MDLEAAVKQYGRMLYRICIVILGSEEDAQDAVQDTFCKYLEKKPKFADTEYEKSWKKKYIPLAVISLLILAAVLYGIRNGGEDGKGGNILAGASPDTSAFQMYYFDGETVVVRTLYDSGTEKEVIKKINGIPLQAAEDIGTSEITVRIANNSGEEFSYGEYFSLQKQIDGQWYTIPVKADNVGFQDIAHILPDGESVSEIYNLGNLQRYDLDVCGVRFRICHNDVAAPKSTRQ